MAQAMTNRELAGACFGAAGAVGRWRMLTARARQLERDWDLEAEVRWNSGSCRFACVVLPELTRQTLSVAIERAARVRALKRLPLLLSRHVPTTLAAELRRCGVLFLDTAGNSYLEGRGLYVWAVGHPTSTRSARRPRAFKTSGLKLLFVLMSCPDALNWTHRELASAAGIALGGVGTVLKDLLGMGYIARTGPRTRTLAGTRSLVSRWSTGYVETLRPALEAGTFRIVRPRELESWTQANVPRIRGMAALLGGEAGAALVTQSFRPERVAIHTSTEDVAAVARELGLLPDPKGQVTLVRAFGQRNGWADSPNGLPLADPLLLHAELVGELDERLSAARTTLLEAYILKRVARDT